LTLTRSSCPAGLLVTATPAPQGALWTVLRAVYGIGCKSPAVATCPISKRLRAPLAPMWTILPQKIYGSSQDKTRYSPAARIGIETRAITGSPGPKHVSTSFVERQNLSVRTFLRRYTRLPNAFSRKLGNHAATLALYCFSYNLIKIHGTRRCSPAMADGLVDRLFEIPDLTALLKAEERMQERAA